MNPWTPTDCHGMLLNEDMLNEQASKMIGCNLEFPWKFLLHPANNSTLLHTPAKVGPSIQKPLSRGQGWGSFRKGRHPMC